MSVFVLNWYSIICCKGKGFLSRGKSAVRLLFLLDLRHAHYFLCFLCYFLLKNSKKKVFPFNTRPLVAFLRAKHMLLLVNQSRLFFSNISSVFKERWLLVVSPFVKKKREEMNDRKNCCPFNTRKESKGRSRVYFDIK
jgi:hypothetical protein